MQLNIGPAELRIEGLERTDFPENAIKFAAEVETDKATPAAISLDYRFCFVDTLPDAADGWTVVMGKPEITVWRKGKLERRSIGVLGAQQRYVVYEEMENGGIGIFFLKNMRIELAYDTVFLSCLSLERHLAPLGCYILHCSYLDYKGEAILFSGPSGIGKSTHSNLWVKNIEGCKILNGDRGLLVPRADGSGYDVCGWPVCGTSGICFNERRPVRAIIFIEQAAENRLLPDSVPRHFKSLIAQLTVNWWNREASDKALDAVNDILSKVTVHTYAANIEDDAPQTLRRCLYE